MHSMEKKQTNKKALKGGCNVIGEGTVWKKRIINE